MADTANILHKRIGMLGLGHVGLTLGLTLADAGFDVYGIDVNPAVAKSIAAGTAHFSEAGLDTLLTKHLGKKFHVVDALPKENSCDIYIVTVGTPLTPDLKPNYAFLEQAGHDLGKIVKEGDLIILRSTVPLGTTRDVVLPRVEKASGLSRGQIHIAFAPERTIEGNALAELRSLPQVVGGLDAKSVELAAAFFETMTDTVVKVASLEEAEIVKLINNAYREVVFSFANEVSLVSREWGLDTKRVIAAANQGYPRSTIPLPSPGVGGYCLTKDGFLLTHSADKKDVPLHIIPQTRHVSARVIDSLAADIQTFLKNNHPGKRKPRIAILGFAFKGKPATSDMRGSMTLTMIKRLNALAGSFEIVGHDPHVKPDKIAAAGATPMDSIEEAIKGSHVVLVMNNNPAFAGLSADTFTGAVEPVLLFDTWGLNDGDSFAQMPQVEYRTL